MIQAASILDAKTIRLGDRLRELGLTQLRLTPDGRATPVGPLRWIEQIVIQSPLFERLTAQLWLQLSQQEAATVCEVWPGVHLAVLPRPQRRRNEQQEVHTLNAVLLLSPELLTSEQLRQVCDSHRLDLAATLTRIDTRHLVGVGEAQRLAAILQWLHEDHQQIGRRVSDLESLSRELTSSYEELSLLYKLSASMTVDHPSRDFFVEACNELREVVNLRWMAMQLIDDDPRMEDLAGQVFSAGAVEGDDERFHEVGRSLIEMARWQRNAEPIVIDDATTSEVPSAARFCHNMLVIPLRTETQVLGVIFGGDKQGADQITTVDSKLCNSLAGSLTIFLENKMLFEDLQSMFMGTLHALTSAIDAKDSYTRGHSERVALMSRLLAEATGLDAATSNRVYLSGLVHDVGKIGVPEAVLCKPGRLTDAEFDQIKRHPDIGNRILLDIRQMSDLLPGVLYHHERWDGRGYPSGLSGTDIPLFGRLICLADSFDAMSSDRTYRRALEHEQVLDEIRRCAGSQFDPDLAERFVELDFEPYFKMIRKHQRWEASQGGQTA